MSPKTGASARVDGEAAALVGSERMDDLSDRITTEREERRADITSVRGEIRDMGGRIERGIDRMAELIIGRVEQAEDSLSRISGAGLVRAARAGNHDFGDSSGLPVKRSPSAPASTETISLSIPKTWSLAGFLKSVLPWLLVGLALFGNSEVRVLAAKALLAASGGAVAP